MANKNASQSGFLRIFGLGFLAILVFVPFLSSAQRVNVDQTDLVPVPYFGSLFVFGPAGELTATGLLLSIIEIGLAIAGMLAVLFLIIGGIRYITAAGNEEQTEAAKKTLTHAILGVVIIILSFVIVRIIANALLLGSVGT